jgi:predicted nucleotidyltransferase
MSGNFVQRGEVALANKWARGEMALKGGADLVIELPTLFASQSAEYFAKGGVKLARAIHAEFLSFGVETDDLHLLQKTADVLKKQPPCYLEQLNFHLSAGLSFPAARAKALKALGYGDVLQTPNNILAVEYLKAIEGDLKPLPILRTTSLHDGVGSASYIRTMLSKGEDVSKFVPPSTLEILRREASLGRFPLQRQTFDTIILAKIRAMPPKQLSQIREVSEGLEHRIKKFARCGTLSELIEKVKTKRYPLSRIRRIMVNILLGITKDTACWDPQYIRILGFNEKGQEILRLLKQTDSYPVIVKSASAPLSPMLQYDFTSTDLFSLCYPDPEKRIGGYDLITSPVVI